jgi:hypothetical protein
MVLWWLLFPKSAHAYVDPGSGSYMLQLAIGALIGGLFALKLFWKSKIKIFFKKLFFKENKNDT